MVSRWERAAAVALAVGLSSGCSMTALMGYRLSPDYPDDTKVESLKLPGLSQPVTVTVDAYGVPHLQAQN
jgi:acyl-homoserine lactone acylase PvdQ